MRSGKGLQRALRIAISAVFRTLVSKQTILNFVWSVNAIDTFQRKNMKTRKKLTLHHVAVSRQSNQKDIVARKSNLIHQTFDLAPQVLDTIKHMFGIDHVFCFVLRVDTHCIRTGGVSSLVQIPGDLKTRLCLRSTQRDLERGSDSLVNAKSNINKSK